MDPTDIRALAAAMERALTDEALRAALRDKGIERAHRFTWEEARGERWGCNGIIQNCR